jgi:hypothetical protein
VGGHLGPSVFRVQSWGAEEEIDKFLWRSLCLLSLCKEPSSDQYDLGWFLVILCVSSALRSSSWQESSKTEGSITLQVPTHGTEADTGQNKTLIFYSRECVFHRMYVSCVKNGYLSKTCLCPFMVLSDHMAVLPSCIQPFLIKCE